MHGKTYQYRNRYSAAVRHSYAQLADRALVWPSSLAISLAHSQLSLPRTPVLAYVSVVN